MDNELKEVDVNLDNDVLEGEEVDTEGTDTTELEVDTEKDNLKRSVNYERKLRKQYEKSNRELEAELKALKEARREPEKSTYDTLVEGGIEESIAKTIASQIDKKQGSSRETEKELKDIKFQLALSEASKNPDFKDIEEYKDEIRTLVDKGLTVEQSYYALTGNKTSNTTSEIKREMEKKLENKQARKEMLGNINNSKGTTVTSTKKVIKATAEEIAIAEQAGMTIEEYIAVKNMDNVKEYSDYKTKK